MTSSKRKLSSEFGIYTNLHAEQIEEIKFAARSLVAAHRAGDEKLWQEITEDANKKFSKFMRGAMIAFALTLVEGDKTP